MRDLTVGNIRSIVSNLINRVVKSEDARFTEVRVDQFGSFYMNRDSIVQKIGSLRRELDELERNIELDRMLFGGSNITGKAADLDAAVNTYVGATKILDELATLLPEDDKPELE